MRKDEQLTCEVCKRQEIPIDGAVVLLYPGGRFPVFAGICASCHKVACLDCCPFGDVPNGFPDVIASRPERSKFLGFKCPRCDGAFPSGHLPIRLFLYEDYADCLDLDAIQSFNRPDQLFHYYGFGIDRIGSSRPEEEDLLRDDRLVRCSSER